MTYGSRRVRGLSDEARRFISGRGVSVGDYVLHYERAGIAWSEHVQQSMQVPLSLGHRLTSFLMSNSRQQVSQSVVSGVRMVDVLLGEGGTGLSSSNVIILLHWVVGVNDPRGSYSLRAWRFTHTWEGASVGAECRGGDVSDHRPHPGRGGFSAGRGWWRRMCRRRRSPRSRWLPAPRPSGAWVRAAPCRVLARRRACPEAGRAARTAAPAQICARSLTVVARPIRGYAWRVGPLLVLGCSRRPTGAGATPAGGRGVGGSSVHARRDG